MLEHTEPGCCRGQLLRCSVWSADQCRAESGRLLSRREQVDDPGHVKRRGLLAYVFLRRDAPGGQGRFVRFQVRRKSELAEWYLEQGVRIVLNGRRLADGI